MPRSSPRNLGRSPSIARERACRHAPVGIGPVRDGNEHAREAFRDLVNRYASATGRAIVLDLAT
jgi:hypothetical protein